MSKKSLRELDRTISEIELFLSKLDRNDLFAIPYNWLLEYLLDLKKQSMIQKNWIWKKKYGIICYDLGQAKKLK